MKNLNKYLPIIFGDEKFTLSNTYIQENYADTKYTKSGQNCIFSNEFVNEENKEDINSLFNYADKNQDGNLTYKQLV